MQILEFLGVVVGLLIVIPIMSSVLWCTGAAFGLWPWPLEFTFRFCACPKCGVLFSPPRRYCRVCGLNQHEEA